MLVTSKKNIKKLSSLTLGILSMVSCSESDGETNEYSNWESRNKDYYQSLYNKAKDSIAAGKTNWKIIKSYSKGDNCEATPENSIVIEVLKQASPHEECTSPSYSQYPYFNDSVRVHYRGRLMPSESYKDGYQFDSSWSGEFDITSAIPTDMLISSTVEGFCTAVTNMHIGDRWLVHIPYNMGYGTTEKSGIPQYSTLNFDITLVAFSRAGKPLQPFH